MTVCMCACQRGACAWGWVREYESKCETHTRALAANSCAHSGRRRPTAACAWPPTALTRLGWRRRGAVRAARPSCSRSRHHRRLHHHPRRHRHPSRHPPKCRCLVRRCGCHTTSPTCSPCGGCPRQRRDYRAAATTFGVSRCSGAVMMRHRRRLRRDSVGRQGCAAGAWRSATCARQRAAKPHRRPWRRSVQL